MVILAQHGNTRTAGKLGRHMADKTDDVPESQRGYTRENNNQKRSRLTPAAHCRLAHRYYSSTDPKRRSAYRRSPLVCGRLEIASSVQVAPIAHVQYITVTLVLHHIFGDVLQPLRRFLVLPGPSPA